MKTNKIKIKGKKSQSEIIKRTDRWTTKKNEKNACTQITVEPTKNEIKLNPRKGTNVKWKHLISFRKLNGLDLKENDERTLRQKKMETNQKS